MIAKEENLEVFIDTIDQLLSVYLVKEYSEFFDLNVISQFKPFLKVEKTKNNPYLFFAMVYNGVFPMTMGQSLYMKIHNKRAIVDLDKWSFEELVKKLKTNAKSCGIRYQRLKRSFKTVSEEIESGDYVYHMKVNENIVETLKYVSEYQKQTNFRSWFTKALELSLIHLSTKPLSYKGSSCCSLTWTLTRINTVTKKREIVFADVGYKVGLIYVSMSGGYDKKYNGIGNLGLIMINRLLKEWGFRYWDLGMYMQYKEELGAETYNKQGLLKLYIDNRGKNAEAEKETDLSKNKSFNNIVEFVNEGRLRQKAEQSKIKMEKRLIKEEKDKLKKTKLDELDSAFVNYIIKKRFNVDIGYKGKVSLFDYMTKSNHSKRLRKRITKFFTVIAIK